MQEAVRGSLAARKERSADAPSGPRVSLPGTTAPFAAAPPGAPTMLDASGAATWAVERDARAAEIAQLKPQVLEAQARFVATKKKSADVRAKIEAARKERQQLDQSFSRTVGTRAAAVEQARAAVRQKVAELGRRALADHTTFGDDLNAAREEAALLGRAADARAHDVLVHEKALHAYDRRAMKNGLVIAGIVALLLLALLVTPVVLKLMPVDPADLPPLPSSPASS
jgi:hypothetical protein